MNEDESVIDGTITEDIVDTSEGQETAPAPKEYTLEQKLARINRMKARLEKELGVAPKEEKPAESAKSSDLGTAEYAYLAAKGIEDDEEIALIQGRMKKWDMTLREVLKDEDIQAKLKGMRIERDVKNAIPSSTKRGQAHADNLDYWKAKYNQTGELPDDFALRSKVVNSIYETVSSSNPPWMK